MNGGIVGAMLCFVNFRGRFSARFRIAAVLAPPPRRSKKKMGHLRFHPLHFPVAFLCRMRIMKPLLCALALDSLWESVLALEPIAEAPGPLPGRLEHDCARGRAAVLRPLRFREAIPARL